MSLWRKCWFSQVVIRQQNGVFFFRPMICLWASNSTACCFRLIRRICQLREICSTIARCQQWELGWQWCWATSLILIWSQNHKSVGCNNNETWPDCHLSYRFVPALTVAMAVYSENRKWFTWSIQTLLGKVSFSCGLFIKITMQKEWNRNHLSST